MRGQRRLAAGGRGREPHLGDLVGRADVLQAAQQLLGAAGHVLRGHRLRRLGPHLVGLRHQGAGLLLGVGALALAALLVAFALGQVGLPADVVDVDGGAVGVEVPHLVDHGVEQLDIVGDHDEAALVAGEEAAQPGDRVGVEVVGRLVEQQDAAAGRGRVAEQDAGQLDAAALAAGERAERLGEDPVGQAEVGADAGGLGLGRVAAEAGELVFERAVAAERPVVGVVGQLRLELLSSRSAACRARARTAPGWRR